MDEQDTEVHEDQDDQEKEEMGKTLKCKARWRSICLIRYQCMCTVCL
jgi:hypothetical protein